MTTDIIIKSYRGDFPWLPYCLRSIQKFATGFRDIVIIIPETDSLDHLTVERVVKVREPEGDGYMAQQVVKLHADTYTDADFILHIDSDCLFTRPSTPEDFLVDGKADWWITPMANASENARAAWIGPMRKCVGLEPEFEYMRRNTMMVPRQAYGLFRDFIHEKHGVSTEHYVMNQNGRQFSEYNSLGFFLHTHHPDMVHWRNTEDGFPQPRERQFWSWGGLTPEVKAEINEILSRPT